VKGATRIASNAATREGPAENAGIREGDLIVSAAGTEVTDPDELHAALAKAGVGRLEIGLVRGVEDLTVKVDLTAGPANKQN